MQFGDSPRFESSNERNSGIGGSGDVRAKVNQALDTSTKQYGVFGKVEVLADGKKYLMRPSIHLGQDGKTPKEFVQRVPILSLEANGEKKELLGYPLETMTLTPEQQKKFKEAGGFEIDCSKMTLEAQDQFSTDNPNAPIDWQVSFETLESEIGGISYRGFDLFKKVYEAFSDIVRMTQAEAIELGIYPTIHYRNDAARKWIAEMNGGRLATLDVDYNDDDPDLLEDEEDYDGELFDIFRAARGETNLQKLAAIGQAPLGWRSSLDCEVYRLGDLVVLGSGSITNDDNEVRTLDVARDELDVATSGCFRGAAVSSIVVMDS